MRKGKEEPGYRPTSVIAKYHCKSGHLHLDNYKNKHLFLFCYICNIFTYAERNRSLLRLIHYQ